MASINWIFLCDYAYVDAVGKASIIGIWERINVKQLPVAWPQMYVVMDFLPDPVSEMAVGIIISAPSGQEIAKTQAAKIKIPTSAARIANHAVLTFGFFNTNFKETGIYHIEVLLNEVSIHTISFTVLTPKTPIPA